MEVFLTVFIVIPASIMLGFIFEYVVNLLLAPFGWWL